MVDVIIIGGGASGMIAAIEASKRDLSVVILDENERLGNKIYATGNGRCNLANTMIDDSSFRGDNPDFYHQVISCFDDKNTLEYFKELGLYTTMMNKTCVYPASKQAASVVHVLSDKLDALRVKVILNVKVESINKDKEGGFLVKYNQTKINCKNVIIACGGKSGIKKPDAMNGYQLASKLGHKIIKPLPALVPLVASTKINFNKLAGVRAVSIGSLYIEDKFITKSQGELQFTNYGVSGIMIFELSRYAVQGINQHKKVFITFDFSHEDLTVENVREVLTKCPYKSIIQVYEGFLDYKLAYEIIKQAGFVPESKASRLTDADLVTIDTYIRQFVVPITDYKSFDKAQVTMGGVDTQEVHVETMESKLCSGLYFAGEVLDVDGNCGGYNLMWAWATGYVAGQHVSR